MAYSDNDMEVVNEKIQELFKIVNDLENTFEGRKFTLDGHLIGSIGEVLASYHYKLKLLPSSYEKYDAVDSENRLVQIKATQGNVVGIGSEPDYLIVLQINRKTGKVREIYNGSGSIVWNACGRMQKNGHRHIALTKLQMIMKNIPDADKIKLINKF